MALASRRSGQTALDACASCHSAHDGDAFAFTLHYNACTFDTSRGTANAQATVGIAPHAPGSCLEQSRPRWTPCKHQLALNRSHRPICICFAMQAVCAHIQQLMQMRLGT
jgi:hypothetical protein